MSTFTQILYQIVFTTKYREKTLIKETKPELFKDIYGILSNKKYHLYQINGVDDHLHIITCIHPLVALAIFVRDIYLGCSSFIREKNFWSEF